MSTAPKPKLSKKPTPLPTREHFDQLVAAANQGDRSSIEQLGKLLDDNPDLWHQVGDLGRNAEMVIILRIAGNDVLTRESIQRQVAQMRVEMYGPAASRMEKLLIDQFIICWLLAQSANMQQLPTGDTSILVGRFVLQQRESAQRQLAAAQFALQTFRKLAPPKLKLREATVPFSRPSGDGTEPKGDGANRANRGK